MNAREEEGSKKELSELIEREGLFREILQQLRGSIHEVFARPETLEKLVEEMNACETDIVKRLFFPIDKTIASILSLPPTEKRALMKAGEEDRQEMLHFVDLIDKEVMAKEQEIKGIKEATKKFRELLLKM